MTLGKSPFNLYYFNCPISWGNNACHSSQSHSEEHGRHLRKSFVICKALCKHKEFSLLPPGGVRRAESS